MKKTLISVFAITSLVTVSLVALKCRLKPPKKEVFNFDEPLKEEEQEVLDENKQLKYDTQNKLEEIKLQIEVLFDLSKKFPSKPDQFEERILRSYDTHLRIALEYAINAMDIVQLFLNSALQKKTSNSHDTVLNSISANVKEIALHLSIYDFFYPLKKQFSLKDIISSLSQTLEFMEDAKRDGMLLTSSVDFPVEKQKAIADIGIAHEFSKEKIRTDGIEEADFFTKKAKMILSNKGESNKAEIKVLGYIIRQVIRAHEKGTNVVVFKYSNYLKKERNSFVYLVEHLDEIEQSPKVLNVKVTAFYIAIYFERK